MNTQPDIPLVSCIMPTCNRRAFVPHAIRYFLRQDYENKELIIADDGSDRIEDIVPPDPRIRYMRVDRKLTLGEKRNFCVRHCKGNLIMHWDDDDWMAPHRISYQVKEMLVHEAAVCGVNEMFFCHVETGECWLYKYPPNAQAWLAGGSLLYTRQFWEQGRFPDIQVASDTQFIFSRKLTSYVALADNRFYVAAIHGNNTSPKATGKSLWHRIEQSDIRNIMGEDWSFFFMQHTPKQMIVKTANTAREKVAILITTFNRQAPLKKILAQLEQEKDHYDLTFFVVDDGILKNGKKNYWKTTNLLWNQAKGRGFNYFIQLPDDVDLEDGFVSNAIHAWKDIDDPRKICLNLLLDGHRLGKTCWTNFWPQVHLFNNKKYLRSQWMDLFYICEQQFFDELQWLVLPVHPSRWAANPELSSGVGQQVSMRLHEKKWHLYQVTQKLAEHIGESSQMNPAVRNKEPMRAATLAPVFAGMASIPGRELQLRKAIDSIIPYIDHLYLFLNDYTEVPAWLHQYKKITAFTSSTENTNMGDAGKFFGLNKIAVQDYYYFSLDDDMVYPPDYTWKIIGKIEKHKQRSIVGCGGYIMKPVVSDFYKDREANWHFSMPNSEDRTVHILHTCLTAWHSSAIEFYYEDCKQPNMGDLWLALAAQKQQVPMVLIARAANWVVNQPVPIAETIYGRYCNNCSEQTSAYQSWKHWKIIPVEEEKKSMQESVVLSQR